MPAANSASSCRPGAHGRAIALPVLGDLGDARRLRPSRSAPRRAIVLAVVQVLMIAHVVQWLVTGHTVSPIEPSESMQAVTRGVINAGAIFFGIALLATLVLGRWFCGWGCHLVMLQDLCGWLMRRMGIRPRAFRSRALALVPFLLALYMFVWPLVYRWGVVPLSGTLHRHFSFVPALAPPGEWTGFSVEVTTTDFWQTFPGVLVAVPFLLICGFATVYFLGAKGFCTYGCPYGGFFAPLEQYAPGRIRVSDACEQCGHCTAVCTSNVRVHEEVREYGMVVDPGCMKCLDCVSVCPKNALSFGFGRPAVRKGAPKRAAPPRRWDLSIGEEIGFSAVFLVSFLAWRGVYDVVPMLMAAGMAGCITFIAWKLWRLVRDPSVNLHRRRLRFRGRPTGGGLAFAALAGGVLLLTAHSGAVNAFEHLAARAEARVTLTRAAIFATAPLEMPPAMAADAARALRHYERARPVWEGGIGLLRHPENDVRRAWLHACRHEFADAEAILREHVRREGPVDVLTRDIALLMGLRLRDEEAEAFAREVVAAHPDFVETFDVLVSILTTGGRFDEAIAVCRATVGRLPEDGAAHLYVLRRLSVVLLEARRYDESIAVIERTIEVDDQNPAAFVVLARAYAARGDATAALAAMRRALALDPDRAGLLLEMAGLLEGLGRADEAARYRARADAP